MATIIKETFTLPSKGLVYGQKINPKVTLRSMTTEDECARLSPNENKYENPCELLDKCIVGDFPISAYDLCLGDYQYLITKLWIVTYGSEYKVAIQCPNCKNVVAATINLSEIEVHELDEENFVLENEFELPVTKHKVKLALQTPRQIDLIAEKARQKRRDTKTSNYFELLYSALALITKVDDKVMNELNLESFVRSLPLKDVYFIINKGDELNGKVGLDTSVVAKCSNCNYQSITNFRLEPELLGPQYN